MRRWWVGAAAAALLAGCGGLSATPSTTGALSHLHADILAKADSVRSLEARIEADRQDAGSYSTVSAKVEVLGRQVRVSLTDQQGQTVTTVDDGTNVWTYQSGGSQYAVQSQLPPTGYDLRWVSFDWVKFLQAVHFTKHEKVRGGTVITYTGSLAGTPVHGTLTVSAALDPTALTLTQGSVTVRERITSYNPAAAITPRTFRFLPPSGATALNTTPPVLGELADASSTLSYSLVVPTVRAGLALVDVTVDRSSVYGQQIIMQYQDPSGAPVLVTEWLAGPPAPHPSGSATTLTVAGRTVTEHDVAGGGIYATVTVAGTEVVAEGPSNAVGALLNNLTAAS
jgi:outer membrane lipoprotein-sorting protein